MQAAFSRPQDLALLALVALVGTAYLAGREPLGRQGAWPNSTILLALAPWVLAFGWERLLRARLRHFAEETPLAADAIEQRSRLAYRAVAHGLVLILVAVAYIALIGFLLGQVPLAALLGALSYAAGVLTGSLRFRIIRSPEQTEPSDLAAAGEGRTTLFRLILRAQLAPLNGGIPAAAALIGGSSIAAFLAVRLVPPDQVEAAGGLALLLPFLLMLASSRMDYATMHILPFAGYSPIAVAAAVAIFPSALAAAVILTAFLSAGPSSLPIAIGALLMLTLFLLIGLPRCWLYARYSRRAADLQVEIEFAVLLLLLFFMPPLAFAGVAWRLSVFYRTHRRLQWQHP